MGWKINWSALAAAMLKAAPVIIRDAFAVKEEVDSHDSNVTKANTALLAADDVAKHLDGADATEIDAAGSMGAAIISAFQTQPPVPQTAKPAA